METAKTDNDADSVRIFNSGIVDTLKAVNQFNSLKYVAREFEFAENPVTHNEDAEYNVRENLGTTNNGKFNVNGRAGGHDVINALGHDIIDGKISEDVESRHSLFEVSKTGTELTLNNLTIKNAVVNNATKNASVIDITASDAKVTLNNITLTNNEGNTIYNLGNLTFNNVIVSAPTDTDANSIQNVSKLTTTGVNVYNSAFVNDTANAVMTINGEDTFNNTVTGSGSIIVNGTANITENSAIKSDMKLAVNKTVNINGGSVVLNNGDSWSGRVNLNDGTLEYNDLTALSLMMLM